MRKQPITKSRNGRTAAWMCRFGFKPYLFAGEKKKNRIKSNDQREI